MRGMMTIILIGALSVPAAATTLFEKKFACPVGGEKFEASVVGSSTSWGQRPDGRAYGTLPIWPMVECPGNGLLLFDEEFSVEDVAKLTPLVASAEYQAMRASESPHYRSWWLQKNLGRDAYALAGNLLAASWEVDHDPAAKARYQQAFVTASQTLPWSEAKKGPWFWLHLRAANALRELSKFDESAALLAMIDRPDRLPTEADELKGARWMIDGLAALNADRNPASEPANLIPAMMAVERCAAGGVSRAEETACNSKAVKDAAAELKGS